MPASSQLLAMIRRQTEAFFPDTCRIEVESDVTGEFRERIHVWVISAEDVPCRLILPGQRYGSGIAEAGSAETMKSEYRLIVARDVTLGVDMRVTVDEVAFNVVRIETALSDEAFHAAILQRRD